MLFHFIFVANFIHDKNPLYGIVIRIYVGIHQLRIPNRYVTSSIAKIYRKCLAIVEMQKLIHLIEQLTLLINSTLFLSAIYSLEHNIEYNRTNM